jgi:hypothetical protein
MSNQDTCLSFQAEIKARAIECTVSESDVERNRADMGICIFSAIAVCIFAFFCYALTFYGSSVEFLGM